MSSKHLLAENYNRFFKLQESEYDLQPYDSEDDSEDSNMVKFDEFFENIITKKLKKLFPGCEVEFDIDGREGQSDVIVNIGFSTNGDYYNRHQQIPKFAQSILSPAEISKLNKLINKLRI